MAEPELPAILRDNAGEICLACRHPNAPRIDDYPFCSSCCDAGWDIAYTRGANAALDGMAKAVHALMWVEHDDPPPGHCSECRQPPGLHKMDCSQRR